MHTKGRKRRQATLDKGIKSAYNRNRKGRCRSAVSPVVLRKAKSHHKKPSLGRVAVFAYYPNRHSPVPDVKSQCNRHKRTPLSGGVAEPPTVFGSARSKTSNSIITAIVKNVKENVRPEAFCPLQAFIIPHFFSVENGETVAFLPKDDII